MRVVGGELGGRRLATPTGATTRPTTDKVRLAVFNSLRHLGVLDGAEVADLFAGSGALGIEALSHGARRCTFVERDRDALTALRENVELLGIADRARIVPGDVERSAVAYRSAEVVFADPPYGYARWPQLLSLVGPALVIAEAADPVEAPDGWNPVRAKRYGRTWVTFLARSPAD